MKINKFQKVQKYDLNIQETLENWKISDAIREVIANAIDEQILTNSKEINILKKDNQWLIADFGRGISIPNFAQNESKEKINKDGIIGKFGIGLKDAIAVLFRNKINFKIITNKFTSYPSLKLKEGFNMKTLHMIIEHIENHSIIEKGTQFIFTNLSDEDMNKARNNFLIFNNQEVMNENKWGQVLETLEPSNSFIYVNGMKIAESESYLFSYNLKKLNKKLLEKMNRERKSIGQEAYSLLIENILKNNLSDEMSEQLFDKPDSGEMQKKNIRKEVFEMINKTNKYVFLTEKQYLTINPNELEVLRTLDKKIKIIKNGDFDLLDSLYDKKSAIEEYNNGFDPEIIQEEDLNDIQKHFFIQSYRVLKRLNKYLELKVVKENNPLHKDVLGYWSSSKPETIFIVFNALNKWESTIITVLHEYAHSIHGNHDNTRDFESDLEKVWFRYSKLQIKYIDE